MVSNFDKNPVVNVKGYHDHCWSGWEGICDKINNRIASLNKKKIVVVFECYHGVYHEDMEPALRENISHSNFFVSTDSFKSSCEIAEMVMGFAGICGHGQVGNTAAI